MNPSRWPDLALADGARWVIPAADRDGVRRGGPDCGRAGCLHRGERRTEVLATSATWTARIPEGKHVKPMHSAG